MYGEKVMENVLFYLAHWIYRKFFAYVHDTFEFTIFTVYVEKKKVDYLK